MEPESSQPFSGDTPVQDPTPATQRTEILSRKTVLGSDVEEELVGLGQKKVEIIEILDQIQDKATSALEFSLHWRETLNKRAMEMEVKEKSLKERTLEVESKEKEVEAKEIVVVVRENKLKEKEEIFKAKTEGFELKNKTFEVKKKEVKEKENDLEKREEIAEAKAREMEWKSKFLEVRLREIEGKTIEQGETSKRPRLNLLDDEGIEADYSLTPPAAKRPRLDGGNKDKETETCPEEVVTSVADQITCVDSEFNDFKKTINSFKKGQVWALYDHVDDMPRLYGRIMEVTKSRSCIRVKWVSPKEKQETVSLACGRLEYGITETKDHLTFSHLMQPKIHGNTFIAVYPKKGETWAMFKDWSKEGWNNNQELHKTPYKYDIVEILVDFDESEGVDGVYLEKVDGFVSVFKQQELVFNVPPDEMNRFSHQVPSFKLSGEEKVGVPVGSFELDPAALPSSMLKVNQELKKEEERVEADHDGSTKDVPILLD